MNVLFKMNYYFRAIVLCLWFACSVKGNSLKDPYICGSPTCIPSEKFKYQLDITYHYEYKVKVNTWFAGTSNNQSTLDVKANAAIQFLSPCEGLLKLTDVTLVDQDKNYPAERAHTFVQAVTSYELRFAFHDGVISEICPDEEEEDWVLNFKRGIVSLFQNTMKRFDVNFNGVERDVHGTCNVNYKVRGQEKTSLIVVKKADLGLCTDRYKYLSILQTVRYNFQSKYQTWPVLTSENKCRISVDHHIYKSVNCKERHIFEPFSGKNSGAMTTVIQDLQLIREVNKTDSEIVDSQPKTWSVITVRSNLLHHHVATHKASTGDLKSAREILKSLCNPADGAGVVSGWGALVRSSRALDGAALAQLTRRAPDMCAGAGKHMMDALPYIASVGSVELIKDMIVEGKVDQTVRDEWLMSMAMIPRPKKEMLKSMLELLEHSKGKPDKMISFTVSSMLHSYCRHSGKTLRECCEEQIPSEIVSKFQDVVNKYADVNLEKATRAERDELQISIKALGNIGGFGQSFSETLLKFIMDSFTPVSVRLTAIDAFRKTPCTETREYFLEMYREDYVNVEVRIASYLQVMKCPNLSTIRKIFHSIKREKVNQVATFVWSHLNNLGQSSLPSLVEIQGLLSGNTVPQLEDIPDFRMFSRNYEQSVFFDQYNAGGNYEANVIFSPDSYIPRSLSLNLTIDMFGESINLLELKARGEGFERYFESIFGNNGTLSKKKIKDEIRNMRFFRSINDAEDVRRKIDELDHENDAVKHQSPIAEIGVKVFGNEISFWNAEGDQEIMASLAKLNPQLRILEILNGKEISYNKASLFLDTTFSVPTGCGLPLNMNLMGTSYLNVNMSGTVVDSFTKTGNLDFQGKIHPSVAVNVAATMGVVAGKVTSTGIRLNTRLYTETAVEGALSCRTLGHCKLDLSLPRNKQEIFAAKSELLILHGDQEIQQQGFNKNRIEHNTCSWSTFDRGIGIKLCAAYQFPNMTSIKANFSPSQFPNMTSIQDAPYFLMSGPSKYILSLEKADPSANTYSFQYTVEKNATTNMLSVSFDTPNSKEKRMFNAQISVSQNSSKALMSFQSAKTTLKAKALYRNLEFDKSLEASLDVDGRKQFDTLMSLKRHDIKYGYVWVPHAYWIVNDEKVAELSGTLKVKSKGGVLQCDISAEFQTKQLASRLLGYYTVNGPTHGTRLQLDYQFYKNPKQTIRAEGLFSERAAGFRHDLYADLSMDFTAYPALNFYAIFSDTFTQNHMDIRFNVSTTRELKNNPNLVLQFTQIERINGLKLDTNLVLLKLWPARIKFGYEQAGAKYMSTLVLNLNPKSRDIVVSYHVFAPPGSQLFIDGEVNVTLPNLHPMTVKGKLHEKKANEFQVYATGIWFTGTDFNIDALYQDQSKTNMMSHRLKVLLNSNHFPDIAVDARFTQDNRQITFIGEGEYEKQNYRTLIRYLLLSEQNFTAYGEVDINGQAYSMNLNADLNNNTNVNADIHFDQIRDIHISYSREWSSTLKRVVMSVHWDANRDPSRRASVDLTLAAPQPWHHSARAALYYPGQLVNAEMDFLLRDWFCQWHIRMGWSDKDIVLWRVKMYSEATNETVYALLSKMNTPFNGWEDTSLNLMWRYHDNLQAINGSMNWQKDYLSFNLLADYLFKTNEFFGELNAVVNSTIPTLPRATAVAKHRVVWKKLAETLLAFQYNEEGQLLINSTWQLDRSEKENNVTGVVTILTPFQGYRKGFLRTKFIFGNKKDINGITYLDLEDKVFKINVNGHMRRITNSMLVINVTSPLPDFSQVTARFGFVEKDRHAVAMVETTTSTTGLEVLLQLTSLQQFHIFGHVALPIQYLNRAMVTAKRGGEEADFRVGWGAMNFGFTGIWHYGSPLNFVYLYKLYTPLEGFEENGFVLKNVYGNGLDTELSLRLSKHKFGIAVLLLDNGKGLIDVITDQMKEGHKMSTDMLIENFDTTASVILDTLYYPTITFKSHMMKIVGPNEEDIIQVNATLDLPQKPPIVLTDVFILEQFTVMRNTLNLVTPFQIIKELKSVYTVDITLGEQFNVTCMALLYNGTYWHEISYRIYYEYESDEDELSQSYVSSLAVITPLVMLPSLEARVGVRLEDSLWKMSADISMPSFAIAALGRLELEDQFVETSGSLNLTSSYLDDYFIKMEFRKDFTEAENAIGGGIQIQQGQQNNYVFADVVWKGSSSVRVKGRLALHPAVPPAECTAGFESGPHQLLLDADLALDGRLYAVKFSRRPEALVVTLASPHQGFRAMKLISEFQNNDIKGSFASDSIEYSITGKIINKDPLELTMVLTPKDKGDPVNVRVKWEVNSKLYSLSAHLTGSMQVTVHARMEIENNYTDVNFKVDIPRSKNKETYLKARVESFSDLRRVVTVQAATPFERLHYLKGETDFIFGPKTGYVLCNYDMPDLKGDGDLKWSFLVGDLFIRALGHQTVEKVIRSVDLDIYFGNSSDATGLQKNDAGFRMDLDSVWQIGANATFGLVMGQRILLIINAILPKPNVDVHTLYINGDIGGDSPYNSVEAKYSTDVTKMLTGIKGTLKKQPDSFKGNASVLWTSDQRLQTIDNTLLYTWDMNGSHAIDYELSSPLYADETTFTVSGSYQQDLVHGYKVVKGLMHQPGQSQIGELDVRYGGTKHTDGHFNFSTPFKKLPWLKSIFDINNVEETSSNKIKLFWPNNTASLNSTQKYVKQPLGFTQYGDIALSVPLSRQHLVETTYFYIQGDKSSNGNSTINLDGERFAKASFNQILSKSERDLDLSTTDIEVENKHTPVGIKYIHEYDVTGNIDVKQATVFHLYNATLFNVTGKVDIFTYATGKNVKLTTRHGQKTVTFENEYEAIDNHLKQGSKIKWAQDVWLNYNIKVTNMTTSEAESQQIIMDVWYPLRTYNLIAVYNLQDTALDGHAQLNWNVKEQNKTTELKVKWTNPQTLEQNVHNVDLSLSHPSFKKDVSLKGQYITTPSVMSNISLELQYSDYENEYLRASSILTDNSNGPKRDYMFEMTCTHPATNLDLEMRSNINIQSRWYLIDNYYRYQNSLFFQKLRQAKLLIDMNRANFYYERANETYYSKTNGTWELSYPDYKVLGYVVRPTGNDTAHAVLSMRDRSLVAHYNSTDDISYHVIGMIVDTRSAKLNAWRNFDDVTTVDLASYIRLNHSRLLTSSVVWRPEMYGELRAQAIYNLRQVYGHINETLVILKEAPMEAHVSLRNIWTDAKIRVRDFLDDLNDLHVIKDDLDDFERFLNQSYEENDFYVKDIVEFTYYVLDEMAIRNHLESLPGIVNDMWGMMGNTSQSIKQSLTYVIDSIKKAYANFLESVNEFLEADFMELVSEKLEAGIRQYDTFVRDLHIKFLEFWEVTWVNATTRISMYGQELMKTLEPTFFAFVHYTEAFVSSIWKGIMDFFYNRTHELKDLPYFNYVATFGHEMDTIYKDLVSDDLITNIKKYTNKLWTVLWEKIEKYIPFKDEVMQLYAEFKNAWENFLKTPQVLYVREKYIEAYHRLKWWYDYFLIGEALDKVWEILYAKVTDMAKTALQYEEEHRTPKTNFIFDPNKGEILLEQKLPMSWHAFNRTPDFTEIAEYKAVRDFLDQWLMTNKSIWSYYYEIRPYMDLDNILPPFNGLAMMTGQGTLVTYDKRVFTISEPGTFLLTKDYKENNFTVLMESNEQGTYNLVILTKSHLLHVDLYRQQVTLDHNMNSPLSLPSAIEDLYVDRDTDVIAIQSPNGVAIHCNLLFATCKISVTGWYYASLGGLLGTYNNEKYDDYRLPNNTYTDSIQELGHSWNIEKDNTLPPIENHEAANDTLCEKFFQNKVSPLHPCFSVIDARPFLSWCRAGVWSCGLAAAYLELCAHQHVPVHIPDHCVQCTTPHGDVIEEGSFVQLKVQDVPQSTDIVFVIEANRCNTMKSKVDDTNLNKINQFIEVFDTQLQTKNLSDNRYAVVGYGGVGLYKKPRALYINNKLFTNAVEIQNHFHKIFIENESEPPISKSPHGDALSAIRFASGLPLRPGVPRNIILLPCTGCDDKSMSLDYSTIYHTLIENSITLHILMDDEFKLHKKRAAKLLFGIDSTLAYTTSDFPVVKGDAALRRQVGYPKDELGACAPLALVTNGTIFSTRKSSPKWRWNRRVAAVWGGRLAGARCGPRCECRDHRLYCTPCDAHYLIDPFWNTDELEDLIDLAIDSQI